MSKPETKPEPPRTEIPRTEPPKAEAKNPFGFGFPEMPWPTPVAYEQWMKAAKETFTRVQSSIQGYWDEVASYENAAYDRAKTATSDLATLATDSLAYVNALTAEWRKASVEATRRVTETFSR